MEKHHKVVDQNTELRVTKDQTVSGWHVATIVIGIAITMPAFLLGSKIMGSLGTQQGLYAILSGGLILSLIASACMYVAVSTRKTTYQILDESFGKTGSRLVSLLIAITLLGWFGVTAALFGQAATKSFEVVLALYLPMESYIIIGSLVMIVTTIYGFRAIDILSKFTVPLMLIILIVGVYFVSSNFTLDQIRQATPNHDHDFRSIGTAISVVTGSFMVGVTILPDYSRFLNRKSQIPVASFGSFGSFFWLVLFMAGLPTLMTGENDLVISMYNSGLGIPALLMMVFATWTTNVSNLYSSSLALTQVFPSLKNNHITIAAGILGCIAALSGIMDYLIDFLLMLGIFVPPIIGIYLAHFFLSFSDCEKDIALPAVLSWVCAAGTAFVTSTGYITLTGIAALDSLFIAMILYGSLTKAYACWPRSQP